MPVVQQTLQHVSHSISMSNPNSKSLHSQRPIGVFDSGIGGLSIAQAVVDLLPSEHLIYFGDTAHLPYGEKSQEALQQYALKITDFFLEQNCKLILIACNSASTAADEIVRKHVGKTAIVIDVIQPVLEHTAKTFHHKKIGLIGTKQTVHSHVYQNKLKMLDPTIHLSAYPAPLLASAIEENFHNDFIIQDLLEKYLSHPPFKDIEALILACTHYPVIKKQIRAYFKRPIDIIDSSLLVANTVKNALETSGLLRGKGDANRHFYVSDYTKSFEKGTKLFFKESVHLEHYPMWD